MLFLCWLGCGLVGIWVDLTVDYTGSKSIGLCCRSIVDEKMGTVGTCQWLSVLMDGWRR